MSPDQGQPPEVLLADYEERCDLLVDLGKAVETLLEGLLHATDLRVHSVVHRVKAKSSAERKLSEKGAGYTDLGDMHDLLGLRIITFFPDEVDLVAEVVSAEFEIDETNSIDKRATLDPDRFGYLSLHYVAKLSDARIALTEYARFEGLPFEIQIRSILQHAWAEIEHDLGYKTGSSIPSTSRRRFSRLAGLLEIADDEFRAIRDDLQAYRQHVAAAIHEEPSSVELNRDSILALMRQDEEVQALDEHIADLFDASVGAPTVETAERLARNLKLAGFDSIDQVKTRFRSEAQIIRALANELIDDDDRIDEVMGGLSLIYLWYLLLARSGSVDSVIEGLGSRNTVHVDFAENLVKSYKAVARGQK